MKEKKFLKLRGLMMERNITGEALSEAIGIGSNTFSKKLNGHTRFTICEALMIMKVLEVDANLWVNYFKQ